MLLLIPAVPDASVQEYRLENGLKVLVIQDRKAPLATFRSGTAWGPGMNRRESQASGPSSRST
ncbi:MAG: hypothetical protein M0C28_16785 [Candidatus Moduliflexus flocculans]|nr:hypothetical protein [Candidatus Moduliflexus flocculans]